MNCSGRREERRDNWGKLWNDISIGMVWNRHDECLHVPCGVLNGRRLEWFVRSFEVCMCEWLVRTGTNCARSNTIVIYQHIFSVHSFWRGDSLSLSLCLLRTLYGFSVRHSCICILYAFWHEPNVVYTFLVAFFIVIHWAKRRIPCSGIKILTIAKRHEIRNDFILSVDRPLS